MKILMYTCFAIGFALAIYDKDLSESIWIVSALLWYTNYINK